MSHAYENETTIITRKSSCSNWKWLRKICDDYERTLLMKEHNHIDMYGQQVPSFFIEKYGVETEPYQLRWEDRTFKVVDLSKFTMEKMLQ